MARTSQDEILNVINAGIDARMSIMIEGDPGQGKSALVRSIAEQRGYRLITIIGSQRDSTDITGFPVKRNIADKDGRVIGSVADYAIQKWQWEIMRYRKVVLFLDEFSNSPPPVQASMLSLLNEREFPNGDKMPNETIVIGAMNPVDSATNGFKLGLPVSNRLMIIPWNPSPGEWMKQFLDNWGHPEDISPMEMKWRRTIVEFLKANPSLLYKLPDQDMKNDPSVYGIDPSSSAERDIYTMAYPTNRSWTNLARIIPNLMHDEGSGKGSIAMRSLQRTADGVVGYEAASAFVSYVKETRGDKKALPSATDVINNPSIINWEKLDAAQSQKLLSETMRLLRNNTKNGDTKILDKIVDMFITVASTRTDIGAPYVDELVRTAALARRPDLVRSLTSAYRKVGERLAER